MTDKVSSSSALELMARELKRARMESNLPLEDISRQITIQKSYLENIEEGDFTFLSRAYIFAYIKSYARFLGVGNDEILEQCRKDLQVSGATTRAATDEGASAEKQRRITDEYPSEVRIQKSLVSWKTLTALIVLIAVAVLAALYFSGNFQLSVTPAPTPVAMPSPAVEDTVAVAEQIVDSLAVKSDDKSNPSVDREHPAPPEIQTPPATPASPERPAPPQPPARREAPAAEEPAVSR
ncbi:hypothetical protein G9409_02115 [Chlorobium sp. BLA1]|uniref:helix-turn-helix domain-containing protein n=1 Tax=Candidatus Chlorobium masyuteum TaxID=2716876 RepID=UPI001423E10F|nr:helix-turn-helix domain-containing protein [Candidatus Chlorobium masyuteum]NHQ59400.1 hypothetical protein [Candidatus Chlorobium masyuteum]NTU45716.1 hypothetical protein [Chlorobiaceae bacterium]